MWSNIDRQGQHPDRSNFMNKILFALFSGLLASSAWADNIADSDQLLCASSQVSMCFENGECHVVAPWEVNVPQFIVVDLDKKSISTTKGSAEQRTTPFSHMSKADGLVYLQGFEAGRAFSIVIDAAIGTLTASVARDGLSVSVFGNCTDADI